MGELIRNAWLGWLNYTDKGKAAALFLAVLLFLWLGKYREYKRLLLYTTCMAVLCIFPPTAAILMLYQTRFYDYQWIWSMVPVTLMIAWGGVIFLTGIWENYRKKGIFRPACMTFFVLALLLLCGNMGNQEWQSERTWQQPQIERALEAVLRGENLGGTEGNGDSQDICLLAPREIVEAARAYSGEIGLFYGRNMWDAALNAYSYDVYDKDVQEIYQWMCMLEDGNEQLVSGNEEAGNEQLMGSNQEAANEQSMNRGGEAENQKILQKALDKGVNRILLPESAGGETVSDIERILDVQAQKLDGYYLICIN